MMLISVALTVWLGSMFVYSAGLKFVWYNRAGNLVKPYGILPQRISSAVGFLLPWVELLTGCCLLLGLLFPAGPLLGAILGAFFSYASFRVLLRGADVPCGCTGGTEDRVNRTTLIRAMFITASSFLLLGAGWSEPTHLPILVVVPIFLVSLLPAGVRIYHRIRAAQWQQQRTQHLQAEIIRARHILAASPFTPIAQELFPSNHYT